MSEPSTTRPSRRTTKPTYLLIAFSLFVALLVAFVMWSYTNRVRPVEIYENCTPLVVQQTSGWRQSTIDLELSKNPDSANIFASGKVFELDEFKIKGREFKTGLPGMTPTNETNILFSYERPFQLVLIAVKETDAGSIEVFVIEQKGIQTLFR